MTQAKAPGPGPEGPLGELEGLVRQLAALRGRFDAHMGREPEVVLRGAQWAVAAERQENVRTVRCLGCTAEAGDSVTLPGGVWAIEHARRNGEAHRDFLVTSLRGWRVVPAGPAMAGRP
ncbi:hypothetical protein RM780_08225 [Streptomyces sp. DSM 44917]|uniref:DUF7848 domain-containing protein n=1 Tax=Streptomyces boetiae TaxID=3075541 RepID=A0ABU2L5V5_9ACTN|nr:hypothetical protein [Streptomyces sp. DSM 44917]MDT0306949.1 hypothetical protein [Streptomyces sp. DSM 44917]